MFHKKKRSKKGKQNRSVKKKERKRKGRLKKRKANLGKKKILGYIFIYIFFLILNVCTQINNHNVLRYIRVPRTCIRVLLLSRTKYVNM
jgi:hypothetical protein